jgi:hypothetical protein
LGKQEKRLLVEENLEELIKALTEKELKELSQPISYDLERELREFAEASKKELEELFEIAKPCHLIHLIKDTEKPS